MGGYTNRTHVAAIKTIDIYNKLAVMEERTSKLLGNPNKNA
jgi:hypothetical protein